MDMKNKICRIRFLPEAASMVAVARSAKAQGSLEYIMMLSAASIVILIALAMIVKLKGAAVVTTAVNGSNTSISQAILGQLSSLAKNAA